MQTRSAAFRLLGISLIIAGAGTLARADVTPYAGGGEIPTPFEAMNRFLELADGEAYDLVGQVVAGAAISGNIPYGQQQAWFQPDFAAQPWLASQKRLANPGYPMENALWYSWSPYAGQLIHVKVVAHGVVMGSDYVIFLGQDPSAGETSDSSSGHSKKHKGI